MVECSSVIDRQCFGGVALPHDKVTNCSKVQVIVKVVEVPQKSNILDYKVCFFCLVRLNVAKLSLFN